jgi:hypothetical protein
VHLVAAGYSQHAKILHWSQCCKMQLLLTSLKLLVSSFTWRRQIL